MPPIGLKTSHLTVNGIASPAHEHFGLYSLTVLDSLLLHSTTPFPADLINSSYFCWGLNTVLGIARRSFRLLRDRDPAAEEKGSVEAWIILWFVDNGGCFTESILIYRHFASLSSPSFPQKFSLLQYAQTFEIISVSIFY